MSDFFLDSERVKIEFPDGQWIEVKEELTQADQDYILSQMAKTKGAEVEMSLGRLALLERAIVAWSFSEPISRDNISRLRQKYRTKLLVEIDKLTSKAMEFVTKN